jgi:hypothetical protein
VTRLFPNIAANAAITLVFVQVITATAILAYGAVTVAKLFLKGLTSVFRPKGKGKEVSA